MLPPIFIVEECEYCKKKKVIRRKGFTDEWVCPSCGKTNRKETLTVWLL